MRRLPLDLEAVRILEQALSQLYALEDVVGEAGSSRSKIASPLLANTGAPDGLQAWMPRSPEDEPRIPALYLNAWKGEPDVLLALISRALRLEQVTAAAERDVMLEQVELDQLEQITDEATVDAATTGAPKGKPPPESDRTQLERYRRALRDLLRRGQRFITATADATLAGWAFTYLTAMREDVGSHPVRVKGHGEPLMPRADLAVIRLELLVAYLSRDEHDPICLASARGHLAAAIRDRPRFAARDRERLDEVAFQWAGKLLQVPADLPKPDERAHGLGLGVVGASLWLENYAKRSQWQAIEREAGAAPAGFAGSRRCSRQSALTPSGRSPSMRPSRLRRSRCPHSHRCSRPSTHFAENRSVDSSCQLAAKNSLSPEAGAAKAFRSQQCLYGAYNHGCSSSPVDTARRLRLGGRERERRPWLKRTRLAKPVRHQLRSRSGVSVLSESSVEDTGLKPDYSSACAAEGFAGIRLGSRFLRFLVPADSLAHSGS